MNYDKYSFSVSEMAKGFAIYVILSGLVAYFFYRSVIVFIFLLPGFFLFLSLYRKRLIKLRGARLVREFSETLSSVSTGMRAGYSLENAFLEAYKDLCMFYGENSLMAAEILRIRKGLSINITIEELIKDLADRSNEEEILMFSEVLRCAKRNGGNLTEVLTETADKISERICVDNEISLLIAEKRLELLIMEAVPFFILLYLDITSKGYFDVLYSGVKGRIFMTVCLAIYILALIFGEHIMKIKV